MDEIVHTHEMFFYFLLLNVILLDILFIKKFAPAGMTEPTNLHISIPSSLEAMLALCGCNYMLISKPETKHTYCNRCHISWSCLY